MKYKIKWFRILTVVHGEVTLNKSNIYRWYKMFSEGRRDVKDEIAESQLEYMKNITGTLCEICENNPSETPGFVKEQKLAFAS